jgi:hypothetical protein
MNERKAWEPTDAELLELWDRADDVEELKHGSKLENDVSGRPGRPDNRVPATNTVAQRQSADLVGDNRGRGGRRPRLNSGT